MVDRWSAWRPENALLFSGVPAAVPILWHCRHPASVFTLIVPVCQLGAVTAPWQLTFAQVRAALLNAAEPALALQVAENARRPPGERAARSSPDARWRGRNAAVVPEPRLVWQAEQTPVTAARASCLACVPATFGYVVPAGGFPWHEEQFASVNGDPALWHTEHGGAVEFGDVPVTA